MPHLDSTRTPDTPPVSDGGFLARRDLWAMVVGGSAILLLYLLLLGRDALDSPSAPPTAPRARAVLVVESVEVLPAKADGRRWDVGWNALPDPRVTVVNRTAVTEGHTAKVVDTLKADFNLEMVRVREGDEIYVRVDDIDLQLDDLIGEHRFRVTRDCIERGELELEFGQVKCLKLRFKPLK
jgi:hypothetical protein